jgi:sensor c-di-GMP phosphodiesterase-like protein
MAGFLRRRWHHDGATGIMALMPRKTPPNPMTEIEDALEAGEFIPYYQPVVDIRTGQLRGAEVLVRWRKPDGTLVLPGSFIPLMESSGFIRDLTRNLMQKVCKEAGASIGRRPDLKISFNFAGKLFSEPTIVKDVRNICELADQVFTSGAGSNRARPDRELYRNAADHRCLAGPWCAYRDR